MEERSLWKDYPENKPKVIGKYQILTVHGYFRDYWDGKDFEGFIERDIISYEEPKDDK